MDKTIKRIERVPIVRTSRAGIQYVKYIDPTKSLIPTGFMNVGFPKKIKEKKLEGSSGPRGHFQRKPYIILILNAAGKAWLKYKGIEKIKSHLIPRKYLQTVTIYPKYK